MMQDTSVVDDYPTAWLSAHEGSAEPSPAKSSRKAKSSEAEGFVTVNLPSDGFMYSDPSLSRVLLSPSPC